MKSTYLHLFEAFGIELEYMVVDQSTLNVRPIVDQLFFSYGNTYDADIERGNLTWSNELALHCFELKSTMPCSNLEAICPQFISEVHFVNEQLKKLNAKLLPTAMHPWMNPDQELRLWPHGDNPWYAEFDRIFNCKGHGWANLQSLHINFPYASEEEFVKLHASIRLVLPLLPALAASSPIVEGKRASCKDMRLQVYKNNAKKIPSITGLVIPEVVTSFKEYHDKILHPIQKDLEPHDHKKILNPEWANSRGAIVRFERGSIEVRLIDVQESPLADLSIVAFVTTLTKWLSDRFSKHFHTFDEAGLKKLLDRAIIDAEDAIIDNEDYLQLFGWKNGSGCTQKQLLSFILETQIHLPPLFQKPLEHILREGTLSTRILKALSNQIQPQELFEVYNKLADVLDRGTLFTP